MISSSACSDGPSCTTCPESSWTASLPRSKDVQVARLLDMATVSPQDRVFQAGAGKALQVATELYLHYVTGPPSCPGGSLCHSVNIALLPLPTKKRVVVSPFLVDLDRRWWVS